MLVIKIASEYIINLFGFQKNKRKYAIARQLDMEGPPKGSTPEATPTSKGHSPSKSPSKIAAAVLAKAAPHIRSEIPHSPTEKPKTSLDALKQYSMQLARKHRERLSAARKAKALAKATPTTHRVLLAYKVIPHNVSEQSTNTPIVVSLLSFSMFRA